MTDWDWWQDALENPKEIGKRIRISPDEPEQGFFRTRFKNKPWEPVAIWRENGEWIALRNGRPVNAKEVWNWCCRYPVTAEAYEIAVDGGGWADDDPNVAAALRMAGHNVGDLSDFELLQDEIESAKQGASIYWKITDDDQAGKAQSLRARMNELSGKADKLREAEKKPHREAANAVDAQWMPLVKDAKAVANALRAALESFETEKLAERRRLEQARREEAAKDAGVAPAPQTTIKGNYGRAATIGVRRVVIGITDYDALLAYYRGPRLQDALLTMAQSDVDYGHDVPGVAIEERATVK